MSMNPSLTGVPTLDARQLADTLIPQNGEGILEEFLLWPPDLFAFTSQVLITTGAYYLVISPPGSERGKRTKRPPGPPEDAWAKPSWAKYVRNVGLKWRERVGRKFDADALSECKRQDTSDRAGAIYAKVGRFVKRRYKWPGEDSWV